MIIRSSFNNELKGDVLIPRERNGKTIILLGGLPSYLHRTNVTQVLVDQGFTVIQPFYYGTWVSGGDFNPKNCWKTLEDTVKSLQEGSVLNLYSNQKLEVEFEEYYVIGTSFGSVVAQSYTGLLQLDKRILLGGIPFFQINTNTKMQFDGDHLVEFIQRGFEYTYRSANWDEWRKEFRGEGVCFNKVHTNAKYLFLQGDRDTMGTKEIISEYISKHNLRADLFMITGGHSLDSLDAQQIAERVKSFMT